MSASVVPYIFGSVMVVLAVYLLYSASKIFKVTTKGADNRETVSYNPTKAVGYVVSAIVCLGIAYMGFTLKSFGEILAGINKLDQQMRNTEVNQTSFSFSK